MSAASCPNCGAPITGPKCEYCGTLHGNIRTYAEARASGSEIDPGWLETVKSLVMHSVISVNEARQMVGMEGLED